MAKKISFIGTARGNFSAKEVYQAVLRVLGKDVTGYACTTDELPSDFSNVDLVVCVATLRDKIIESVPQDKVLGIDLVPTTDFFTRIAAIPAGETAYLFSDSIKYAKWMIQKCKVNCITQIHIEIVQAAALSEEEIEAKLAKARYIIGVENTVGEGGVLRKKFGKYLREDVNIIGALRTASLESACELMQWSVGYAHQLLLENFTIKMQQLSGNVGAIADISTQLKDDFHQEAERFQQVNQEMGQKKEQLAPLRLLSQNLLAATKNIGDVTGAIRHISAQTNLLALNATIEAARVGEQGRGFAVVAREVGKLAAESRRSTEEIHQSIESMKGLVEKIAPEVESLLHLIEYNQEIFIKAVAESKAEEVSLVKMDVALKEIYEMSEKLNEDMKTTVYQ